MNWRKGWYSKGVYWREWCRAKGCIKGKGGRVKTCIGWKVLEQRGVRIGGKGGRARGY